MLSEQTIQKLSRLYKRQETYEPNLEIADKLANKTIVMLIGGTGVGKNTLMDTVASLNNHFCVSSNRTSRAPRDDDNSDRYTYYQNSDDGLQKVIESIEKCEMVQYAVNPYSQLIYCSVIEDYPGEYNLKDVFSSAVDDFRRLGFKRAVAITVASDPEVWLKHFEERYPKGHPERRARRDENIESLTWSLLQTQDHFWVENIDGNPEAGAREIIAITLGESTGQPEASKLAKASLNAAWSIAV